MRRRAERMALRKLAAAAVVDEETADGQRSAYIDLIVAKERKRREMFALNGQGQEGEQ